MYMKCIGDMLQKKIQSTRMEQHTVKMEAGKRNGHRCIHEQVYMDMFLHVEGGL